MKMDSITVDKEYQAHFMEIKSMKIKIEEVGKDKLSGLRDECYKSNYLYGGNI